MYKPSSKVAKIAVAALAIPMFGGFATYAAAQVSTKPAPQVVIPGGPATDDTVRPTRTTVSDDPVGHDANDDKGGRTDTTVSDDPAGHDANDDHGGRTDTTVSDDPAGHDANDDKGHDAVTPGSSTPTTVDDHGGKSSGSGRHGSDG